MRAFTIIEMLITFFILSLMAGAIFAITNISILSWNSNRGMLEVVQDVRQTMDGMIREIRQSNSSLPPSASSEFIFSIPDVTNEIKYYINNSKQLIREHPPGSEPRQVLANNISSLYFIPVGPRLLQIQVQATKVIRNTPHNFSLTEEVKLRNE